MTNENVRINDEIILDSEKIANAKGVFEISLAEDKFPFIIKYSSGEKRTIVEQLENIGCSNLKQLDFANCIAVNLSMTQLKAIKSLNCVESVERDYDYRLLSIDNTDIKETVPLAKNSPQKTVPNVKIAVFDAFTTAIVDEKVNFVNDEFEEQNDHGTKMIGIITSAIKNADNIQVNPQIFSVVVANYKGFAKTSTIMQGLDWAINNEVNIINMSFGDYHRSLLLEEMVDKVAEYGIIMVAASGNDGQFNDEERIMYPAAFDSVISVGAKIGDSIAAFSNGDDKVDVLATGSQSFVDLDGQVVNVMGTSAAAALVSSEILKTCCETLVNNKLEILAKIKDQSNSEILVNDSSYNLTTIETDAIIDENVSGELVASSLSARSTDYVGNNRLTAKYMDLIKWYSGRIKFPRCQEWYRFTANAQNAHPNRDKAYYVIRTRGSLDTIGELYDSNGNYITWNDDHDGNTNFEIVANLEYGKTYYICVRAFGNHFGDYDLQVTYFGDDHGNTMEYATKVTGIYYENKSIEAGLHANGDIDYYKFSPAKNCVMEIYTEGDTNTYGRLYCSNGSLYASDNDSNGNGNFKLRVHLESNQWYYLAVSHNSSSGYGEYNLRFKFIKDFYKIPNNFCCNLQKPIIAWFNNEYTETPSIKEMLSVKHYMYTNKGTALLWRDQYLTNATFKDVLTAALEAAPSQTEMVLNELGIIHISTEDVISDMIVSALIAFVTPFIDKAIFNMKYNNMTDSDIMQMCEFTLRETPTTGYDENNILDIFFPNYIDQKACYIYEDSSLYLYGYDLKRGKWSEIYL